jgi:hypothetical protein
MKPLSRRCEFGVVTLAASAIDLLFACGQSAFEQWAQEALHRQSDAFIEPFPYLPKNLAVLDTAPKQLDRILRGMEGADSLNKDPSNENHRHQMLRHGVDQNSSQFPLARRAALR